MLPATDAAATTARTDATDVEVSSPPPRSRWREAIVDASGVAAATIGLLVVTLRLWEANLRVPFVHNATDQPPLAYAPDAPYYLMLTKGLVDHGSYLRIPNLSWPFSLQLYDNPESGDNLQLALLRGLGFVLRDAVLTVNVYYLFTFVAVSLAAWFVLRRLGVSRLIAAVVAILYCFLPYHFARGEAHLLLSGYFMVPIARCSSCRCCRTTHRSRRAANRPRLAGAWPCGAGGPCRGSSRAWPWARRARTTPSSRCYSWPRRSPST